MRHIVGFMLMIVVYSVLLYQGQYDELMFFSYGLLIGRYIFGD